MDPNEKYKIKIKKMDKNIEKIIEIVHTANSNIWMI
jgi:hypothetical protein